MKRILLLCIFSSIFKASGMNKIDDDAPPKSYPKNQVTYHDKKKNLWVVMEPLDPETKVWWHHKTTLEIHVLNAGYQASHPESYVNEGISEFESEAYNIVKQAKSLKIDLKELQSCKEKYSKTLPSDDKVKGYLGAIPAFQYNLAYNHYAEPKSQANTWIAYVSDEKIENSCSSLNLLTPRIKMAMTVQIASEFYCPLGIYKSPIGETEEKFPNLSLFFHQAVAGLVQQVEPQNAYMVVRPLDYMEKIFQKSGIPFSISLGGREYEDRPYILGVQYPYIMLGRFQLIDPTSRKVIPIYASDFFNVNDYIAGNKTSFLPYMCTSIKDLKKGLK